MPTPRARLLTRAATPFLLLLPLLVAGPAARAVTPPPLLYPSAVAPGAQQVLLVEGVPYASGMTASDPSGDVTFGTVSGYSTGELAVRATVSSTPASTGPHDVVFTDPGSGTTTTCTGCLTPAAPVAAPQAAVTPGDQQLSLSITPPTVPAGDSLTGYHVLVGSTAYETTQPSLVATGLSNGVSVAVTVVARLTSGLSLYSRQLARPGTVPTQPTVTAASALRQVAFTAVADSWGYSATWSWDVRHSDGNHEAVDTGADPNLLVQDPGPGQVTATVVATDRFGPSARSAAVSAPVLLPPDVVRNPRFDYTRGTGTLTWSPPLSDGNSAITGYDVRWQSGTGTIHASRVSATSARFSLPPGIEVHGDVRALNALGVGERAFWGSRSSVGLAVALDGNRHAAYRLLDRAGWQTLSGPRLDNAPSVTRSQRGTLLVVGREVSTGWLWGRSLSTGWRVLSKEPCLSPSASFLGTTDTVLVACLDGSGRLKVGYADVPPGGVPARVGFGTTGYRPVGRPEVVAGDVLFLSAAFDAAGHNLNAYSPGRQAFRRLPLRCTSDPGGSQLLWKQYAANGSLWAACADGPRYVRWLRADYLSFVEGPLAVGALRSAVDLSGRPGVWTDYGGQPFVSMVAGDGTVREMQLAAGRWRTITGLSVLPGLSAVGWYG